MALQNERLAAVEQRLSDHETRCEERLADIKLTIGGVLKAVEGLRGRSWAIVIALLAWALAQIWSANQARVERLEATPRITGFAVDQPQPPRL